MIRTVRSEMLWTVLFLLESRLPTISPERSDHQQSRPTLGRELA